MYFVFDILLLAVEFYRWILSLTDYYYLMSDMTKAAILKRNTPNITRRNPPPHTGKTTLVWLQQRTDSPNLEGWASDHCEAPYRCWWNTAPSATVQLTCRCVQFLYWPKTNSHQAAFPTTIKLWRFIELVPCENWF